MDDPNRPTVAGPAAPASAEPAAWVRPAIEVIPLDCEITAYAPDGDTPLF
jgi:hypothetical protein